MLWIIAPALCVAGCQTTASSVEPPVVTPIPPRPAPPISEVGLETVMGKNIAVLQSLFGAPRLDVREPVGRKLQYIGRACILDAYLYPEGQNGEEIVKHIDARRRDGAEVDRAACVNALKRQ